MTTLWGFRPTPLANSYRTNNEPSARYPLQLSRCRSCGHIQCPIVVDPRVMFEEYAYVSGTSPSFVEHFRQYAKKMEDQFFLSSSSLVVEFGSNDGTMLRQFSCRTLGVDPSVNIAAQANADGIETRCAFFTPDEARSILTERGHADLIVANNVMAHMEDVPGTVEAVRILMSQSGAFVFEVSYGLNLFQNGLFDTVYHEHLHYHTIHALDGFFRASNLELFDVEAVPTHGGSIRVYVGFPGQHPIQPSVSEFIRRESEAGILGEDIRNCIHRIRNAQFRVSSDFERMGGRWNSRQKNIIGYGSPAKSVTLLSELLVPSNLFSSIVDDNPLKQGKIHPSHDCPIISHEQFMGESPDLVVILAWNFSEQIRKKIPSHIPIYIPTLGL